MKTKTINLYSFDELTPEAQKKAISNFRNDIDNTDFIYDEAHESVEKFHDIFGTKEGRYSWLDINTGQIDDAILRLSGLRLQKYLWNNYRRDLFKGKYYSLWSKTEVSYQYHKEGYPVLKSRHSKIILDNSCVMTGVCYDMHLLDPIYDYLDKKDFSNDTTTFEDLLNKCIQSLEKSIYSEVEYQNSEQAIKETIEANEYTFEIDGTLNNG